jgi:hypothetical protein
MVSKHVEIAVITKGIGPQAHPGGAAVYPVSTERNVYRITVYRNKASRTLGTGQVASSMSNIPYVAHNPAPSIGRDEQ